MPKPTRGAQQIAQPRARPPRPAAKICAPRPGTGHVAAASLRLPAGTGAPQSQHARGGAGGVGLGTTYSFCECALRRLRMSCARASRSAGSSMLPLIMSRKKSNTNDIAPACPAKGFADVCAMRPHAGAVNRCLAATPLARASRCVSWRYGAGVSRCGRGKREMLETVRRLCVKTVLGGPAALLGLQPAAPRRPAPHPCTLLHPRPTPLLLALQRH